MELLLLSTLASQNWKSTILEFAWSLSLSLLFQKPTLSSEPVALEELVQESAFDCSRRKRINQKCRISFIRRFWDRTWEVSFWIWKSLELMIWFTLILLILHRRRFASINIYLVTIILVSLFCNGNTQLSSSYQWRRWFDWTWLNDGRVSTWSSTCKNGHRVVRVQLQ